MDESKRGFSAGVAAAARSPYFSGSYLLPAGAIVFAVVALALGRIEAGLVLLACGVVFAGLRFFLNVLAEPSVVEPKRDRSRAGR